MKAKNTLNMQIQCNCIIKNNYLQFPNLLVKTVCKAIANRNTISGRISAYRFWRHFALARLESNVNHCQYRLIDIGSPSNWSTIDCAGWSARLSTAASVHLQQKRSLSKRWSRWSDEIATNFRYRCRRKSFASVAIFSNDKRHNEAAADVARRPPESFSRNIDDKPHDERTETFAWWLWPICKSRTLQKKESKNMSHLMKRNSN